MTGGSSWLSVAYDWSPLADAREAVYVEGGPGKLYLPMDSPDGAVGAEPVIVLESVD